MKSVFVKIWRRCFLVALQKQKGTSSYLGYVKILTPSELQMWAEKMDTYLTCSKWFNPPKEGRDIEDRYLQTEGIPFEMQKFGFLQ